MRRPLVVLICLAVLVTGCRPMGVAIRAMENDLTILDCYRTDKHKLGDIKTELQGELRLRANGTHVDATLTATPGDIHAPDTPKMQWAGTGKRVGDRLELVLDRTSGDSAAPLQVHYNADIHHSRLRGFLFDPNFGLHDLRGSLLMDSCYQANEVDVPAVSNTVGSGQRRSSAVHSALS
jgi:hypothetical protein